MSWEGLPLPKNEMCRARMEIDKKQLFKLFPRIAEELDRKCKIEISVRPDTQTEKEASSGKFTDYTPDVIDFLRRCDNEEQAKEIIDYLERRGEIDKEYALRLRRQLKGKGLRSFGIKKEEYYYFKHGEP
jgi:hypothetical protein